MSETIINIITLLVGLLMVLSRKTYARFIVKHQNKLWGFHFGERSTKISEVISVIVGAGLIIFSLLSFSGVIRFR